VGWKAPSNHSRKDWVGLYRVCACIFRRLEPFNDSDDVGWGEQEEISDKGSHDGHVGAGARGRMGRRNTA